MRVQLLAATLLLGGVVPAAADIHALVVGIDDYRHITPLKGAVNDALDISNALQTFDVADLTLLIDAQATREAVLGTLRAYALKAQSGDTVLFTYAGHGANEPAAHPETEEDGMDETFLLAGFAPTGPGAADRIRDDELAEIIASRPDVQFTIVADSCHSGTATRASAFDATYRVFDLDASFEADSLPPPPPPPPAAADGEAQNSTFFAAVSDAEKAPEVGIDGKMRGALSYAFADGLRGAADGDGDGVITKGELEQHVRRYVRTALDGRQRPQVDPPGQIARPLFALSRNFTETAGTGFALPYDALPPLPLRIEGAGGASPVRFEALRGVVAMEGQSARGLVIDLDRAEIRSAQGDFLRALSMAVGHDWQAQVQATVDRYRAVRALEEAALPGKLEVYFGLGEDLYYDGRPFGVNITGRSFPHVTLFDLMPDGTIAWLYPRYAPLDISATFNDPPEVAPNKVLQFDAWVTPPFGAEHILAIETAQANDALRQAAADFDGSTDMPAFWEALRGALDGKAHSLAIHPFFTRQTPAE